MPYRSRAVDLSGIGGGLSNIMKVLAASQGAGQVDPIGEGENVTGFKTHAPPFWEALSGNQGNSLASRLNSDLVLQRMQTAGQRSLLKDRFAGEGEQADKQFGYDLEKENIRSADAMSLQERIGAIQQKQAELDQLLKIATANGLPAANFQNLLKQPEFGARIEDTASKKTSFENDLINDPTYRSGLAQGKLAEAWSPYTKTVKDLTEDVAPGHLVSRPSLKGTPFEKSQAFQGSITDKFMEGGKIDPTTGIRIGGSEVTRTTPGQGPIDTLTPEEMQASLLKKRSVPTSSGVTGDWSQPAITAPAPPPVSSGTNPFPDPQSLLLELLKKLSGMPAARF